MNPLIPRGSGNRRTKPIMTPTTSSQEAVRILDALEAHGLGRERLVPILKKEKRPAVKHTKGKWSEERCLEYFKFESCDADKFDLGFLCSELIVLDYDSIELYDRMVAEFPELKETVRARTGVYKPVEDQGVHCYFLRTALCDELKIWDKSRRIFDPPDAEEPLELDIKTICSTGSSGVVVCHPSKGKRWILSIVDAKPLCISDELATWVRSHTREAGKLVHARDGGEERCAKRPSRSRESEESGGGVPTVTEALDGEPIVEASPTIDAVDAAQLGFTVVPSSEVRVNARGGRVMLLDARRDHAVSPVRAQVILPETINTATGRHVQRYKWHDRVTPCPLCGDVGEKSGIGHTSQFEMVHDEMGERWIWNHSHGCRVRGRNKKRLHLPMSDKTVKLYTAAFEAGCTVLSEELVADFRAWAARSGFAGAAEAQRGLRIWRRWYFVTTADKAYFTVAARSDPSGGATTRFEWWEDEAPWRPGGKRTKPAEISPESLDDLLDILGC